MFSIRKATVADIPFIREITMQVWPQTYLPIIGSEQVAYMLAQSYTPEALQQQMAVNGHQFIICGDEQASVAFASYSEIDPGIYKLHKLYVIRTVQGRGTGRDIVNYISAELKNIGATALRLNVNRFNTPAIAFYNKLGFAKIYDEDIDIGNGYFMNDHVLELPL